MNAGWRIAQRALSPAVNDRGTAIDIIGTFTRLLRGWSHTCQTGEPGDSRFPHVHLRALHVADWRSDPI